MSLTKSVEVRNAQLDAMETAIGTSPHLKIRTGAAPTHTSDASTGTVLATIDLPSDWMAAASAGAKAMSGTWEDTAADNAGTAAHFEIVDNAGTKVHLRGSVSASGGGGDLIVDNVVFAVGQDFTVTAFTITAAGA